MDKIIFNIIKKYHEIENELYFKLEKELGVNKADELLGKFVDYREQQLKIGKYLDENKNLNKDGFLNNKIEELERYTRVHVIYEYDNGLSLCETTAGFLKLVPNDLISYDTE
ncbi:hypothetical protein GRF59_14600 [Paenibacillus sp. HJL G12]|uniref:Uncharacterized protein n=1 Tax=Paenibacillus dendrobii TaxID=2691084 RepID=A0A7X3IJV8_9BACL|nr:hypothetical protein [Paenibacillus dendrobii]MWV44848.1 hypothetical protein [Paenibacillus dendrobii]